MTNYMLLNGPNLNLLGTREPDLYGSETLEDIEANLVEISKDKKCNLICHQSNAEHELVDLIHSAKDNQVKCIIINPGALTHYSYTLRDAISSVNIPTVEVHLSDINNRENFRKNSVIKDVCIAQITGLGKTGYLEGLIKLITNTV